jgi:signal transduction histidine kinase/CheY-like chemotaxis protein
MMGIILIFPLNVALKAYWKSRAIVRPNRELLLFSVVFIAVLYLLMSHNSVWNSHLLSVWVAISMLLWSSFRFNWLLTPIFVSLLSVTMFVSTLLGRGPFENESLNSALLDAQFYLLIVAATALMVMAEVMVRKKLLRENMTMTKLLEQKVEHKSSALSDEIEQNKELLSELDFQEKAYRQAQSLANIGHWILNHHTGKLIWSEETYSIFEQDKNQQESSYENFLSVVHPEDRRKVTQHFEASLTSNRQYDIEHRLLFPEGRVKHVAEHALTKFSDAGDPIYSLGTVQDITESYVQKQNLIHARKEAENANQAKSQFLSMMSHELRTPMNGVLGMAQLMEIDGELEGEQKECLKAIITSGESLVEILTAVLDFAKIESGKQDTQRKLFNGENLLRSVCELFEGAARSKGIKLKYQSTGMDFGDVFGDEYLIRRILINLVGNAVKYTEEGIVNVTAEFKKLLDADSEIILSVTDTGIGIPDEMHHKIFEEFQQVDASLSRKYGGTGLGLSITQKLAKLLGGEIWYESEVGKGSSFHVRLPLQFKGPSLTMNENSPTKHSTGPLSGNILLVEDNPINIAVASKMLRRLGVNFDTATDGKSALLKSQEIEYDLILLDIVLPEMDGYEVANSILNDDENPNVNSPIIALTAQASDEDHEKFLQLGMREVIRKPINLQNLSLRLEHYLSPSSHG